MGELFKRMGNSIKTDLQSTNEVHQSLALALTGALAPKDLVEVVYNDVLTMAMTESSRVTLFVRKKAILCLLRIFRKYKDKCQVTEKWPVAISAMLDQKSLGFLSAAVSLLNGVVYLSEPTGFEECVPKLIRILYRLIIDKNYTQDYLYYGTPNPWLLVKCLKGLQNFPPPDEEKHLLHINEVLTKIVTKTEVTKSVNKNNSDYGVLFEAINLIIHYRLAINSELRNQMQTRLGVFISVKEPNVR